MWAFECLGPSVLLEFEPTQGGLIIQCERYLKIRRSKVSSSNKSRCVYKRNRLLEDINQSGYDDDN